MQYVMPRNGSVLDPLSDREEESLKMFSRVGKRDSLLTSAAQALSETRKARCKFVFSHNIHKIEHFGQHFQIIHGNAPKLPRDDKIAQISYQKHSRRDHPR